MKKTVLKIIRIQWGHGISKCPIYSKLLNNINFGTNNFEEEKKWP